MKIGLVSSAAMAALVLSTTAFAQAPAPAPVTVVSTADYTEQRLEGNQVVSFPGDTLPGDLNSPYGGRIVPLPRVLRAGLIRPRVNFVSELLKTVENL